MTTDYFSLTRSEIEPLLPPKAQTILDVGSGAGATAAWVKSKYPGSVAVALEGNSVLLEQLQHNVDEAHIVDLDGDLPDIGAPDLALFLDVLEHLKHPERVLAQLTAKMPEHGTVIVSVPNVAHLSVSAPLFFKGEFKYRDAGILDRTHLRFFVLHSAIELLNSAGFVVTRGLRTGFRGPRTRALDFLTWGTVRNRVTKQFILQGRRGPPRPMQAAIAWTCV